MKKVLFSSDPISFCVSSSFISRLCGLTSPFFSSSAIQSVNTLTSFTYAQAEAAAAEAKTTDNGNDSTGDAKNPSEVNANGSSDSKDAGGGGGGGAKLSLLGVGGVAVAAPTGKSSRITAAEIRIQKDIAELDSGNIGTVAFPNPNDLTMFTLNVAPDSGYWSGAKYAFTINIPATYPHEAPKVHCDTKIFHPNIDLQGHVCLNILRKDWKPVLDINAVIYGIIYLFYEPNPDDPLNKEAAALFREDQAQFGRIVKRTLSGQSHSGETFPRLI